MSIHLIWKNLNKLSNFLSISQQFSQFFPTFSSPLPSTPCFFHLVRRFWNQILTWWNILTLYFFSSPPYACYFVTALFVRHICFIFLTFHRFQSITRMSSVFHHKPLPFKCFTSHIIYHDIHVMISSL